MIGLCSRDKQRCLRAKLFIPRISAYKNATTWVLSMNFHQKHASPWLTGWPSTRIRSCCVLSAFIINKSKTMESKGSMRLALQKISTCSLTHDVSSLEDDNINCEYAVYVILAWLHPLPIWGGLAPNNHLRPTTFYWSACTKPGNWAVIKD